MSEDELEMPDYKDLELYVPPEIVTITYEGKSITLRYKDSKVVLEGNLELDKGAGMFFELIKEYAKRQLHSETNKVLERVLGKVERAEKPHEYAFGDDFRRGFNACHDEFTKVIKEEMKGGQR